MPTLAHQRLTSIAIRTLALLNYSGVVRRANLAPECHLNHVDQSVQAKGSLTHPLAPIVAPGFFAIGDGLGCGTDRVVSVVNRRCSGVHMA